MCVNFRKWGKYIRTGDLILIFITVTAQRQDSTGFTIHIHLHINYACSCQLRSLVVRAVHRRRTGVGSIPAGGPYS